MSDRAAPASAAPPSGFIDRTFRLAERSTSAGRGDHRRSDHIRRDGLYTRGQSVDHVDDRHVSRRSRDRDAELFGSALMGLCANLPPAMGSNVIFAGEISGIAWGWGPYSSLFSTSPRC